MSFLIDLTYTLISNLGDFFIILMYSLMLWVPFEILLEKLQISYKVTKYIRIFFLLGLGILFAKLCIDEVYNKQKKEMTIKQQEERERWVKDSTEYFNKKYREDFEKEIVYPHLNNLKTIEICIGQNKNQLMKKLATQNVKILKDNVLFLTIKLDSTIITYYFIGENENINVIVYEHALANDVKVIDDYLAKLGFKRLFNFGVADKFGNSLYYLNNDSTIISEVLVYKDFLNKINNDSIKTASHQIQLMFKGYSKFEWSFSSNDIISNSQVFD